MSANFGEKNRPNGEKILLLALNFITEKVLMTIAYKSQ
jgi:hypothetical protein